MTDDPTPSKGLLSEVLSMPKWRLAALVCSALVGAGGLCMTALADGDDKQPAREQQRDESQAQDPDAPTGISPLGLAPVEPGQPDETRDREETIAETDENPSGLNLWGPVFFKMGFSFFIGFAVGHALRIFVKTGMLIVGAQVVILVLLQGVGWIQIDWDAIKGGYDSFATWVTGGDASFISVLTGQLPSAASATAGIVIGFKRGA